jgi:hypothetical protein
LLVKYSTAVLIFVMLAHFVAARGWKRALSSAGPWLAAATCLLAVSMHLLWLYRNGFPTLHYAAARAGSASGLGARLLAPLKFAAAQLADLAPAVALAWISRLRPARLPNSGDENLRFLCWMVFGPPLLVIAGSLATGMGVRDMWGAPMWNLAGLLIVLSAAEQWERVVPQRLAAGAATLFAIGLAGFVLADVLGPEFENRPSRIRWPDREIAQTAGAAWRQQLHAPLKIIASDGWLGGLVAMRTAPRPSVWTDADYRKAPWITPQAVARDGVLVLWQIRGSPSVPRAFDTLKGIRILGQKTFTWPDTPKAKPLMVGYGIVPPAGR